MLDKLYASYICVRKVNCSDLMFAFWLEVFIFSLRPLSVHFQVCSVSPSGLSRRYRSRLGVLLFITGIQRPIVRAPVPSGDRGERPARITDHLHPSVSSSGCRNLAGSGRLCVAAGPISGGGGAGLHLH